MPLLSFLGDWAIPVLLDIGALAVSLVFLLLVYAGDILFATPLRLVAGIVPFIGTQLANGISSITGGIKSWATNWAGDNVKSLVRLVNIGAQMVVATVGTIVGAIEWIVGQMVGLTVTIWQTGLNLTFAVASIGVKLLDLTGLTALAQAVAKDAQNTAEWTYKTFVPAQIQSVLAQVNQTIDNAVGAAVAGIRTDIADVQAGIETDLKDVADGIRTDIADVQAGIETDLKDVADGIRTDIADVQAGLQTDIADVTGGIEKAVEDALGVGSIFAIIDLVTLIFRKPDEAAQAVAASAEDWYHIAEANFGLLRGEITSVGLGSIAWPERKPPAAPTPPHGQ